MKRLNAPFALFLFLLPSSITAQDWIGSITDNQATMARMHVQPAALADMPWKWTIMPVGLNFHAFNTSLLGNSNSILREGPLTFLDGVDEFFIGIGGQLPSFGWRINDRLAIGLQLKLRGWLFTETSNPDLLQLIEESFDSPDLVGVQFNGDYLTGRAQIWGEINPTFAYRLFESDNHALQAGLTFKVLNGFGGGYLNADNLNFVYNTNEELANFTGNLQFLYNIELDQLINEGKVTYKSSPSVGADIGLEYVFSPNQDGYLLKAGVSLIDMGKLRYRRAEKTGAYRASFMDIDFSAVEDFESFEELSELFQDLLDEIDITEDEFQVRLPTRLGLQLDYHIAKMYYLNFSSYIALNGQNRDVRYSANFSNYILTPRIEKPTWSIQLPMYYHQLSGFSAGLTGRVGPVFLGVPNLFAAMANDFDKLNIYLGFRFGGRMK